MSNWRYLKIQKIKTTAHYTLRKDIIRYKSDLLVICKFCFIWLILSSFTSLLFVIFIFNRNSFYLSFYYFWVSICVPYVLMCAMHIQKIIFHLIYLFELYLLCRCCCRSVSLSLVLYVFISFLSGKIYFLHIFLHCNHIFELHNFFFFVAFVLYRCVFVFSFERDREKAHTHTFTWKILWIYNQKERITFCP